MRRVIFLSTFSKSKLALMTLFWSVMFLADVFVIFYGLFELFVAEYLIGLILVVYGIIAIYGNWWHVCVALEQINGHTQLTEPDDDSQSASNDPADPQTQARNLVTDEPASHERRQKKSLTQMLGLGRQSLAEERMASRRRSLGIDSTVGSRSAADADTDAIDWSDIDDSLEMHESLNSRRKAMAARHAESTASQADAAAGSADSAQPAKHGYDLRQIPTLRLAAEPSPEERRVPGELAPDDWIDDDETDKIIKETLAKRQAAESQADDDESVSVDDLPADESVSANDAPADDTDEHAAHTANSSVDDDDIIPDDFDPNDDQAISKMIAQYDAEQSAKSKSDDDTDNESDDDESDDESKSKSDD